MQFDNSATPNSDSLKVPDDSWLIEISSTNVTSETRSSFGSFISPYHILTSSQPVISDEPNPFRNPPTYSWSSFKSITCSENEIIFAPDRETLTKVKVSTIKCAGCIEDLLIIGCHPILEGRHAPMILTLKEPVVDRVFPCLAHNSTQVEVGDQLDSYGISFEKPKLDLRNTVFHVHRHRNITGIVYKSVNTEVNPQQGYEEYGGPLVKMVDGKSTIIGISNLKDKTQTKEMFFDLRQYETVLCNKFGICQKTVAPTTTAPTTVRATYPTINRFDKDGTIWEEKEEEIREEFDGQFNDIEQGEVEYSDGEEDIDFGFEANGNQKRNRQKMENSGSVQLKWGCSIVLMFLF